MQAYKRQEQRADPSEELYDEKEDHTGETGVFRKGEDGKYHWIYCMDMLKNRHLFWFIVKIILGSFLLVFLIYGILDSKNEPNQFLSMLKVMIPVGAVLFLITMLSYWLTAKMYGNAYRIAYEMDEETVTFCQISDPAETAQLSEGDLSFTGTLANPDMAKIETVSSFGGMTTRFSKVHSVIVDRKNHFIGLRQSLFYNMVYADDPYFEAIAEYIVQRAVNAEIKIR